MIQNSYKLYKHKIKIRPKTGFNFTFCLQKKTCRLTFIHTGFTLEAALNTMSKFHLIYGVFKYNQSQCLVVAWTTLG